MAMKRANRKTLPVYMTCPEPCREWLVPLVHKQMFWTLVMAACGLILFTVVPWANNRILRRIEAALIASPAPVASPTLSQGE
jgi:hypothetical protein